MGYKTSLLPNLILSQREKRWSKKSSTISTKNLYGAATNQGLFGTTSDGRAWSPFFLFSFLFFYNVVSHGVTIRSEPFSHLNLVINFCGEPLKIKLQHPL